eukprot:s857_g32.t1
MGVVRMMMKSCRSLPKAKDEDWGETSRATEKDPWLHSDPWSQGGAASAVQANQEWERPPKKDWRPVQPGRLEARLVVKQGAGVSLLWCTGEGYRVQEIEEFPGQPELRVGDIIRTIGGWTLTDAGSVEEAERRFAGAFRDRALLEIERPCFTVTLKVKPDGAGLSLVWHPPEGYLVEGVDPHPGQPGLRAGDVLRRVGPAVLAGHVSQAAADAALAGALQDGALARIYRFVVAYDVAAHAPCAPLQRLCSLMLAAYSALLQRRPLLTKGCSAGLLFSLGDFLAQRLETTEPMDLQRLMAFGSYGASWYAISQHYWFAWMERHVACGWSASSAAVARVAAHSAVFAPFSIVSLFGWMAVTTGRSWQELQDICHPEAIFRTWAAGTIFWIPTMLGVYRFVPLQGRVVVTSGANVLWSCYLSWKSAAQRASAEKMPSCDAQLGDLVASPNGLILPSVAVGTWSWGNESFGHGLRAGSHEAKEAVAAAFNAAVRRGCYFFDSAPTYGRGFAEESLGHLCRSTGQYAVVATKHFPRPGQDLTNALLATAREAARRLALDGPLDLLQLHRPAEPPISLEAQADALAAAVRSGAAKAIGVCNFSLQELRVVHEHLQRQGLRLSTCQVELSLARQLPVASGLVNGCRELGITVLAFSPLAMGRLSGRYDPWGPAPTWSERRQARGGTAQRPFGATLDEDVDAWHQLLTKLRQMGQKYGKTCAQVAINWVLCQGAIALCGARDGPQASENAGAMGWRLSAEDALLLGALGADEAEQARSTSSTIWAIFFLDPNFNALKESLRVSGYNPHHPWPHPPAPAEVTMWCQRLSQRVHHVVLPCARQQTRGPKYARKGIWARGDFGLHSTDDPRIFRPGLRRQYPYHKQRSWSPQYMCLQHNSLAPVGHGVKLAILYGKFRFAEVFYEFQRQLKFHLPGAQILAEAKSELDVPYLKVLRLNDGRTLWATQETDQAGRIGSWRFCHQT